MSAFMVADKTINRVLGWLNDSDNRWELHTILVAAEICGNASAQVPCPSDWDELLGASMFQMNIDAVNERYGENQAQEFRTLDYEFSFEMADDIQVLKSLQCWIYQCSEGDVPDHKLYQAFKNLEGRIACGIVSRTDAYNTATWG